jgi:hypothetical protein
LCPPNNDILPIKFKCIDPLWLQHFMLQIFWRQVRNDRVASLSAACSPVAHEEEGLHAIFDFVVNMGTSDYPSRIPDMHTIHDPMISVSWIHISKLITKLHHPLQYRIIFTIGHMTKYYIAMQGKYTIKQRIPSSVDDPRHAYYPIGNWLGDVPSSHRRHHNHLLLPNCLLQSLTKLIARDKAMSTFWIVLANHLKRKSLICSMAVAREGSTLVCFLQKHTFSCRYSMSGTMFYDISISFLKTFIKQV